MKALLIRFCERRRTVLLSLAYVRKNDENTERDRFGGFFFYPNLCLGRIRI